MPSLIFTHQLFGNTDVWQNECYLIEEDLFFTQYPFHKQKLILHRASMQAYTQRLRHSGKVVHYIESADSRSDCRILIESLSGTVTEIHCIDVVDDWLRQRIKSVCLSRNFAIKMTNTPMFFTSIRSIQSIFSTMIFMCKHAVEKIFY